MIYIAYNAKTGIVEPIAYSKQSMVPVGFLSMGIEEEEWEAAKGKEMRVVDGKFVYNDPAPTRSQLSDYVYAQKAAVAYGGVTVLKNGVPYVFETDQNSITMCNSQAIAISATPAAIINWKVWQDGFPTILSLTSQQFLQIFGFGMQMINTAFGVEGQFDAQIENMTDEQLEDPEFVSGFKAQVSEAFEQIDTTFVIE